MLPPAFLDLPTVDTYPKWPIEEGFLYLGYALRIEYLTHIHNPLNEPEIFFHEFATGVRAYEPSYCDLLDQLVLQTPENRKLVLASPFAQVDFEDAYFVGELSEIYVAWDAEGHNLVLVTPKGEAIMVLREGNLGVVESGMIVG